MKRNVFLMMSVIFIILTAGCKGPIVETPTPTIVPTRTSIPMTYERAVEMFEGGKFSDAILYFRDHLDEGDSKRYLEKSEYMFYIQGGWGYRLVGRHSYKIIISGWKVRTQFAAPPQKMIIRDTYYNIRSDEMILFENGFSVALDDEYTFKYVQGEGVYLYPRMVSEPQLIKRSDERPLYQPEVGMTADQVIGSIYMNPTDINTTKTANTTYEQWIYRFYGIMDDVYIYLENGTVTSISY